MARKLTVDTEELGKLTLKEVYEEWIYHTEAENKSADTIRNYKLSYNKFINFFGFDDKTFVDELNEGNILHWKNAMLKDEKLSGYSINHYLRDVRTLCNFAINRKYIENFEFKLIKFQEEAEKSFKTDDVVLLLEKPKGKSFVDWRTWAMVNWVCATGNREATICDVRIGDADIKEGKVYLRHTKAKKYQSLPMSKSLSNCLKEYIRVCRKDCSRDDYLFPSTVENRQLTTNALRKAFTNYCDDRGVEQHNFHGLRHWFAINWINNNGNLYQLQVLLGHSTPAMTQKYLRTYGVEFNDFEEFNPLDQIKINSSKRR